jgi:antitoxin component of MazEF toxin-antitoxin module
MALVKYLTKHGNSFALVIDRPILNLLRISPDSPLEVTTDGQRITISIAAELDVPKRRRPTKRKRR